MIKKILRFLNIFWCFQCDRWYYASKNTGAVVFLHNNEEITLPMCKDCTNIASHMAEQQEAHDRREV